MNKLYYVDNLDVLRKFIRDETVDFCYLDPPFNSKRNYNQIYNNIGGEDRAQAQAFMDTWTWDDHANECFDEILSNANGVQTAQSIALIGGLEKVLGKGAFVRLSGFDDRPHRRVFTAHSNRRVRFICTATRRHRII